MKTINNKKIKHSDKKSHNEQDTKAHEGNSEKKRKLVHEIMKPR